jgi:CRP/FNR family cyclic AMP-dependent transcriptional regulator
VDRFPGDRPVRAGSTEYAETVVTIEFFHGVDFFRGFGPAALTKLAAAAEHFRLQRGDALFEEGDTAADAYIVKSGRIAIANRSVDGRESIVALMTEGDLFGEMALFDGQGRSTGARALEVSEVVRVPFSVLRSELEDDNQALWNVIALLVGRLRATDEALADSVFLDVTGRTAKRLLEIAGEQDEFVLPITQEELAGMIGASRERVNKAIAQFVRLGWLEQHERTYRITDRKRMTLRAS